MTLVQPALHIISKQLKSRDDESLLTKTMSNETLKIAHTPGPWKILPMQDGFRIRDQKHLYIASIISGCYGWVKNAEANAKLIAAAPELLEVLREMMIEQEFLIKEGKLFKNTASFFKAQEAIKKATE